MKHKILVLSVLMLLMIAVSSLSFASEEVQGRVREMKDSYISIVTSKRTIREFNISDKTPIFVRGFPSPIKHILPNSIVRIFVQNGKAEAIFVQEAPK